MSWRRRIPATMSSINASRLHCACAASGVAPCSSFVRKQSAGPGAGETVADLSGTNVVVGARVGLAVGDELQDASTLATRPRGMLRASHRADPGTSGTGMIPLPLRHFGTSR